MQRNSWEQNTRTKTFIIQCLVENEKKEKRKVVQMESIDFVLIYDAFHWFIATCLPGFFLHNILIFRHAPAVRCCHQSPTKPTAEVTWTRSPRALPYKDKSSLIPVSEVPHVTSFLVDLNRWAEAPSDRADSEPVERWAVTAAGRTEKPPASPSNPLASSLR